MPRPYVPKDPARAEHIATVSDVVFASPDGDYVILAGADGSTMKGMADRQHFTRGATYRFFGGWEPNGQRGMAFRFKVFVPHLLHGKAGIVSYLTKYCEGTGLGEKTALKLWDRYRGEAVETLRTEPDRAAAECGLSPDVCRGAAAKLEEAKRFETTRIDLFELLGKRGFSGRLIDEAIRKWGIRAPHVVRKNPFNLLGLPSAGFKRCDRLWKDLDLPRIPREEVKRGVACVGHILSGDPNGHTWLPAADLANRLREVSPQSDPLRTFRVAKRAKLVRTREESDGTVWVAAADRAEAEERIARSVGRLLARRSLWPAGAVPVSREEGDGLPTAHQAGELGRATRETVGLFTGGPGTGKTFSLAHLLREVVLTRGLADVAVASPTGKAAVRATQAMRAAGLPLVATTIHRLLEIARNGHDGGGWGFKRNRRNPLDQRFVVIDEASMVPTDLAASLLEAVDTGGHVLFVGDPYQLPPVGHGAPLRDLIAAGLPRGELTEIHRNAGQIVLACRAIKGGDPFESSPRLDLAARPPANLLFLEEESPAEAVETLTRLLTEGCGRHGFNGVWDTQVILASNSRGELSRVAVNDKLRPMLNPDAKGAEGNPFGVGDKIICLRNSQLQEAVLMREAWLDDSDIGDDIPPPPEWVVCDATHYTGAKDLNLNPVTHYVANGEIGRVVAAGPSLTIARMGAGDDGGGDGPLVRIPMAKAAKEKGEGDGDDAGSDWAGDSEMAARGKAGSDFDHAYAVTVHRSQGSQWPCVVILADRNAGGIADRHWWYTAVSRAAKACVVIGPRLVMEKQRARQSLVTRKTFLKELVVEAVGGGERREAA